MMNSIFIYTLLITPVFAVHNVVQVRPCSGNRPFPREVRVDDCSTMPCKLSRGRDASAEVDFIAPYDTANLRAVVVPIALGVELPFVLPPEYAKACNWLINSGCPISAGDAVTYNLKMPVQKAYPRIRLAIETSLIDEQQRTHACFELDIGVV
ncbi:AAEL009557-PA [Aedes aegypti]|uniref:AAEL009557-PA n=1 Tax=Aedes aegypti TaxID=7159 RepID=Q16VI4_AEDAE|nr:AAEL009557-PA [Aedes aegypti]